MLWCIGGRFKAIRETQISNKHLVGTSRFVWVFPPVTHRDQGDKMSLMMIGFCFCNKMAAMCQDLGFTMESGLGLCVSGADQSIKRCCVHVVSVSPRNDTTQRRFNPRLVTCRCFLPKGRVASQVKNLPGRGYDRISLASRSWPKINQDQFDWQRK